MAIESDDAPDASPGDPTVEEFGRVSRTAGTVFRYLLLAATLVGLVALAVLLVYVANDAFQPLTADSGWYLVFGLTLVAPTVTAGWILHRRYDGALRVGGTALAVPAVGLLFGGGVALLFVDVVPAVAWLAYYVAIAVPSGVLILLNRSDVGLPFPGWVGVTSFAFAVSLALVPRTILSFPLLPTDGLILVATLGIPAAWVVRRFVSDRWDGERIGDLAGSVSLLWIVLATLSSPLVGLTPVPAAVLATFVGLPTGLYLATVFVHRPTDRVGLLFAVVVVAGALVGQVAVEGLALAGPESWVDWHFLTSGHDNDAAEAGLYPAIAGTAMLMLIVAAVSFPLGVGAAIYLEEYAPENRYTRLVRINVSNLAGVPSVVYGILGLGFFVSYLGDGIPIPPTVVAEAVGVTPVVLGSEVLNAGTVLVGGLTLSLLILPIVIISAQEAIRSVPDDLREASYGMGATRWQTTRRVVLPRAFPGILTGTILALGRAIGETAPLIVIAAPNVFDLPASLGSPVGAMPLQIYAWASFFASEEFWHRAVPAGVVVLLVTLLAMNSIAIALRSRYRIDW